MGGVFPLSSGMIDPHSAGKTSGMPILGDDSTINGVGAFYDGPLEERIFIKISDVELKSNEMRLLIPAPEEEGRR
jgi:hypothetical protein